MVNWLAMVILGLILIALTEEMMEIVGHKNAVLDDASSFMSLNN